MFSKEVVGALMIGRNCQESRLKVRVELRLVTVSVTTITELQLLLYLEKIRSVMVECDESGDDELGVTGDGPSITGTADHFAESNKSHIQ